MPAQMDNRRDALDAQIAVALHRAGTPSAERRAGARRAVLAEAGAKTVQASAPRGLWQRLLILGARCAAWFLNDCVYERARTAALARPRTTHTRLAYAEFTCSL